jgi:penicillin-binding protein 1C
MKAGAAKRATAGVALLAALAGGAGSGLSALDRAYPPPVDIASRLSVEVRDRDGRLLRAFAGPDGRWRLAVDPGKVDADFLAMLVAYEDKRFWRHCGVDPLAMARAAFQLAANGRIVSGGSTITMQVARLLEPRAERSLGAKLRQMARAIQIERRLSKREILQLYLALAPYGGNVEGVRAASLTWFGKEPVRLTAAESALLVALPQSPELRRPDRHAARAKAARDLVLARLAAAGVVGGQVAADAARAPAPARRLALPHHAPHLAEAARDRDPKARVHATRLDRDIQARLETLAAGAARQAGPRISVAMVMADWRSGDILASVGSAGFLEAARDGAIDMTQALRSPGSALKPFVYGLAIEDGLVQPETLISDRPADFSGYRPVNFDLTYQGDVSVRRALQLSLNVPAVRLLDAVGPSRLLARLKRAGVNLAPADARAPGLALALGGASISLTDLVQLYANLASPGSAPVALGDGVRAQPGALTGPRTLSPAAAWQVGDMLSGLGAPWGSRPLKIAYKTGTSYGYRDAWAVGFDGRHVIGVWIGRPDNGPAPGIGGQATAAPLLFEAFEKSGVEPAPLPRAPAGALRLAAEELPPALRRFESGAGIGLLARSAASGMQIAFPANGAVLESERDAAGALAPVAIKIVGGTPPFRLLADGRPQESVARKRQFFWTPEGPGTARLTVLDVSGRAQTVSVIVR